MKNRSQANRGKPFEDFLKMAHTRYQNSGLAVVHKVPTEFIPLRDFRGRVVNCKVEEKSCVDYLGRYRNIAVAVEAKHTERNRIEYSAVQQHQADFLDDWTTYDGAIGIVVVSFGMERFFAVPWDFWRSPRNAWQQGKKVKIENNRYGWKWQSNGMASVSPEELLPEWEIKPGGNLLLPYLHIIDDMIRQKGEQK